MQLTDEQKEGKVAELLLAILNGQHVKAAQLREELGLPEEEDDG